MRVANTLWLFAGLMAAAAGAGGRHDDEAPDYTRKPLGEWIEALKDQDKPECRYQARKALGPGGPYAKVAVPALIEAFGHKEPPAGSEAAETLGDYGLAVVPLLMRALKRPEATVRAGVTEALGHVWPRSVDVVPALMVAMKDTVPAVRAAAAESIARIGRPAD
jgi:HEAT repeat protein